MHYYYAPLLPRVKGFSTVGHLLLSLKLGFLPRPCLADLSTVLLQLRCKNRNRSIVFHITSRKRTLNPRLAEKLHVYPTLWSRIWASKYGSWSSASPLLGWSCIEGYISKPGVSILSGVNWTLFKYHQPMRGSLRYNSRRRPDTYTN